ncbi:MAG: hypothetical protein ACK58T_14465, partial [Phycisphaerae bacterium]
PVQCDVKEGPFQPCVLTVTFTECFPDAATLVDLVPAQSHHLTKVLIRSSTGVPLRPSGSTFTDNPVALADSVASG